MTDVTDSGIWTTASDLLFTGEHEGYFYALNAPARLGCTSICPQRAGTRSGTRVIND
jgi:hypothetical protein